MGDGDGDGESLEELINKSVFFTNNLGFFIAVNFSVVFWYSKKMLPKSPKSQIMALPRGLEPLLPP